MDAKLVADSATVAEDSQLGQPVKVYGNSVIEAKAKIGKYSVISSHSTVGANSIIGNYCTIGANSKISVDIAAPQSFFSTHSFQYSSKHFKDVKNYTKKNASPESPAPTVIGNDVWIGSNVSICKGVTVGTGAIIASNSFVAEDVPAYAEVSGNPAKVVRYRFDDETISQFLHSGWWELEPKDMSDLDFQNPTESLERINSLKLHLKLKNRNSLAGELKNSVSGTNSGIIWFSTPYAYADMDALESVNAIKVISHEPGAEANAEVLSAGIYPLAKSTYDPKRGWYRLDITSDGSQFKGKIAKNKLTFQLVTVD
ncbi:CatB-related O-acetyltransferase [Pseudomonas monteilii]|uniref:CatB-related O-acetyltransferase n=1 Tax=Pseudomonas monteilii TaxID=76759 RepID=UPI001604702C|nr:CatB-related O-acetyltransferase [Pseudomonas monteilii]